MPRKTKPDLSGVLLKLERADEHIETIRKKTKAFREGDPAPFGFRPEAKTRPDKSEHHVLYAIVREEPPRTLAPIIGDVIHNIRSALEHLIYELSSKRARKSGKTQFPIFDDECRFKVLGIPMIDSITGNERTLIERVQPYAASNPPRYDPLAILRELSNLDKHRLLVPMIAAVSLTDSWVASDNADIVFTHIEGGPVKHGTEIVAFTATPTDPSIDMTVNPQSGLQIEISDTGADDLDIEVVDLLEMIHHHVRRSIIEMWFERGFMPRPWAELHPPQ